MSDRDKDMWFWRAVMTLLCLQIANGILAVANIIIGFKK